MGNTPGQRWEKPLDDQMAMSGLGGWDCGGRPAVYCHTSKVIKDKPTKSSYCYNYSLWLYFL